MICLFCRLKCRVSKLAFSPFTAYICENCLVDDMSKYIVSYKNYPTSLFTRTFIIDNYHISINYEYDTTTVSKLEYCFLTNQIIIPRAVAIDTKNPYSVLDKIKTLLIFS
jgi:hypothetical protein